uniref:ArsR/SmtB family transcription factor n=1 Tax=Nocardia cyriacigeorgica TaxID=135487 RepID=UPI003CC80707
MSSAAEKIFEALGDPVRRRILELVAGGEQPAGTVVAAVQEHTAISQPGVSQHLKVLRDAGLVTVRAEGNRRLYAVDPVGVEAARAWLAGLADPLAQFAQPLDARIPASKFGSVQQWIIRYCAAGFSDDLPQHPQQQAREVRDGVRVEKICSVGEFGGH